MIHLITGYAGYEHIQPEDDGALERINNAEI